MAITEHIRGAELDINTQQICGIKSAIIWGFSKYGNEQFPIAYIKRPKGISKEDFEDFLHRLTIYLQL